MSISSEISRLQTAKADIKTSIENKGVTVPSNATLDSYDDYIDQISGATPTQTKSVTITSNTTTTVRPDTGYDLSEVSITTLVPEGASDIQDIGQKFLDIQSGTSTILDLSSQSFSNFNGLSNSCTQIKLPSTCTRIPANSFSFRPYIFGCSVEIPNTVTLIDRYAFARAVSLDENESYYKWNITFEAGGNQSLVVAAYAFQGVKGNSIVFPARTLFKEYGSYGGPDRIFENSIFQSIDISACTQITSLGNSFFYNCSRLSSVSLPSTVTSIGENLFSGCVYLTSVDIPSSVTSMGGYTFYNCGSLTTLTIPAAVTSIGNFAFMLGYNKRIPIHFLRNTPPTIQSNTFGTMSVHYPSVIYVPYSEDHSVLQAYKTAQYWSSLASLIQEEPQS